MEAEWAIGSFRGAIFCVIRVASIVLGMIGLAALTGCGRAGGDDAVVPVALSAARDVATETKSVASSTSGSSRISSYDDRVGAAMRVVTRVNALRRRGEFEQFIDAALNAAADAPESAPLARLAAEAHLAAGAPDRAEASALRAGELALASDEPAAAVAALRLWITARLRMGQPLDASRAEALFAQVEKQDGAPTLRYWVDALGDRCPYEHDPASAGRPVDVPPTAAADGTIWADLNAIRASANGVELPMVFVDTGTQHTIMTRRAAAMAGLAVDDSATRLVGFGGLDAQPAVLESLALGELTLRNVPVLVGNSAALMSANGQMAIGTELMHHVRFTLDYPNRQVSVEYADGPASQPERSDQWAIPLWTFSRACLTRADTTHGLARVLVDTGNRTGTYLSARWARRHLPTFRRPEASMIFKFRHQGLTLDTMELGSATLLDWPIWDRIPRELERIDVVDVLLGRDLLWSYRITIDLPQRVMWIDGGSTTPIPPTNTIP